MLTQEDKQLIAEYMGWTLNETSGQYEGYDGRYYSMKDFDLNDAGLCVQEMQKRGEFAPFYDDLLDTYNGLCEDGKATCGADNFAAWLFIADNFFGAMAAWRREGKK